MKAIVVALAGGLLAMNATAQAQSLTTKVTYDPGSNVATVTDPRGLVTTYAHDGLGQLWRQVSPDTGATQYSYDGYGRLASMTRADGAQTTYGYDGLNRRTSISAGSQTQTISYDTCTNGKGRMCSASDTTGSTSYSYTPEGWVAGRGFSVGGSTYALGYNYDAMGRLTVVNYPDSNKAIYYYTNGAVNSVQLIVGSNSSTWAASNVSYRPGNAAMSSWTSSNGLVNTLSYDSDERLVSITAPGIQSLGFSYDNVNRITQIVNGIDSSLTQDLGYDAQSRLASVYSGAENESYQYDADGNRITANINGIPETFGYSSSSNQMTSFSSYVSATYGYDALGNTTSVNGGVAYQFNPFNRMISSGGATNYINPEGQRLRKMGGSTGTTLFAPDGGGNLMAENDNGTWVDYVSLNGRLIGRISGGAVDAIHTDQVNRPEVVTDANKNVVWRAQNFPFTNNVTVSTIALNLGFPGQYYDAETWTWNNGYRDYNSGFGRYLQSDPMGLKGGINTYVYVNNYPIAGTDPYGLFELPDVPQWAVNSVAGFGDGISLGLSAYIRRKFDWGSIDPCDSDYQAAVTAGHAYDAVLLGVGAAKAAPYIAPYVARAIPATANFAKAGVLALSLHVADPADMDEAWGPVSDIVEQLEAHEEAAAGSAETAEAAAGAQQQLPTH